MTGPTLLILGIGPLRERLFAVCARRGVRTVLVDETAYSRYDSLADENYAWILNDHGRQGRDFPNLAALADTVDGIVSFTDWGAAMAAGLAASRGLPNAGHRVAEGLGTKSGVRAAMDSVGIAGPRWRLVATASEAQDLLTGARAGVIVKPIDGTASLGVRRVTDEQSLAGAIASAQSLTGRSHALVEEFIDGPEYALEIRADQGNVRRVLVTEKVTTGPPRFIETRHLVGAVSKDLQISAWAFAHSLVAALEISSAILHVEAKWTGDGWQLIETAFRTAGGLISDIVTAATGRDLYDDLLDVALGLKTSGHDVRSDLVAGVQFLAGTGTVTDMPSMSAVREGLPHVIRAERLLPPGVTLEEVSANWFRAGYVMAVAPTRDVVTTELADAHDRLADLMDLAPMVRQ